jgi:Fe-S-cluster containining protein
MKYQCDKCGACCEKLIIEADALDVLREPRLVEGDPHYANDPDAVEKLVTDIGRVVVISCGKACHFLSEEKTCNIYPTRPNDCVATLLYLTRNDFEFQSHLFRKANRAP